MPLFAANTFPMMVNIGAMSIDSTTYLYREATTAQSDGSVPRHGKKAGGSGAGGTREQPELLNSGV